MWVGVILVLVIAAFIFLIVALLAGTLASPLYDIVIQNQAVQEMGFDTGVEAAMLVGLSLVLPLMALSVAVWAIVLRLKTDPYHGVRGRY